MPTKKKARVRSRTPVTSPTGMVRINLYITARQYKLISAVAKRRGVSFSEVTRLMLDKAVARVSE